MRDDDSKFVRDEFYFGTYLSQMLIIFACSD